MQRKLSRRAALLAAAAAAVAVGGLAVAVPAASGAGAAPAATAATSGGLRVAYYDLPDEWKRRAETQGFQAMRQKYLRAKVS